MTKEDGTNKKGEEWTGLHDMITVVQVKNAPVVSLESVSITSVIVVDHATVVILNVGVEIRKGVQISIAGVVNQKLPPLTGW